MLQLLLAVNVGELKPSRLDVAYGMEQSIAAQLVLLSNVGMFVMVIFIYVFFWKFTPIAIYKKFKIRFKFGKLLPEFDTAIFSWETVCQED